MLPTPHVQKVPIVFYTRVAGGDFNRQGFLSAEPQIKDNREDHDTDRAGKLLYFFFPTRLYKSNVKQKR